MWIGDREKYALIGLQAKLEGAAPPEQVQSGLWVLTDTTFDVPPQWREWLGTIRAEEVGGSNLFLVSKLASTTPGVLDGENQALQRRVHHFYVGLLLSAMFSPAHKPVMLTGARQNGVIDVRQQSDLDLPASQVFRPYPPIFADDILGAARLGQKLDAMDPEAVPGGLWRLIRTLHLYVETRSIGELIDRIHQYCRCIDGLILPAIGRTRQQFKSRTELFIGPGHHDLTGEIYDIRSRVEHLHENRYLETFDRDVRLDLVKKEAVVEYIARKALSWIISREALWPHFGNTAALEEFWALSQERRQELWGDPIDPLAPVADFDPNQLHDRDLGKT